jgi:hypothetical protein
MLKPIPMTAAEQDDDMEVAAALLSCTRFTVDRCAHDAVTHTALWIFDGETQIASISRQAPMDGFPARYPWEAALMSGGIPTAHRLCDSLAGACTWILEQRKACGLA